ncbi:MAG: bifunctional aldolase/short-chain dehydrogenase [Candidatus Marinimicrobia bacterium]|nr:bifunctional aldolase/short-chain dehydrogenase [Candidatus Neomarinimicrobiota bacterium]
MKNNWNPKESIRYINEYKKKKIDKNLALRIYSTHLLGREKNLVLHGGGNTSLKGYLRNISGKIIDVIYVKGSGWDMSNLNENGMPCLELKPLLEVEKLKKLDDKNMVNYLRKNLIDTTSPNPSVETLLHAFLPHKYIDHTHSSAILSIVNQKNSKALCNKVFGKKISIVPYTMPGFELAKKAKQEFNKNKSIECMILLNHGIFTFGESAKESYDRMIKYVNKAEKYINKLKEVKLKKNYIKKNIEISEVITAIRKAVYKFSKKRFILNFYNSKEIIDFTLRKDIFQIINKGPVTPDHVIRIKPFFLILNVNKLSNKLIEMQITNFIKKYKIYFKKNKKFVKNSKITDNLPRIIILPGYGLLSINRNYKETKIGADIFLSMVNSIKDASKIGNFKSISQKEIFKMEYWPLEMAKITNRKQLELEGNIVVITGGCGTIGIATAQEFLKEGAEVVLLDNDIKSIKRLPENIIKRCKIIKCNLTNNVEVKNSFNNIIKTYGGIDILISNAGKAFEGKIAEVDSKIIKNSFEINFFSHQYASQNAVNIYLKQNFGGLILFNISKQSINPGKNFGPYGLPKSTTLFLMKQYALEYSKYNIRFNGINADRIRSGILTQKMIIKRSKARNLSLKNYMKGNLLNKEVTAFDVAKAFVFQSKLKKTTGNIITVDGGNIEASLR